MCGNELLMQFFVYMIKAVARGRSSKKLVLKISQISQENTFAVVFVRTAFLKNICELLFLMWATSKWEKNAINK